MKKLLLVALLAMGCASNGNPSGPKAAPTPTPVPVATATPAPTPILAGNIFCMVAETGGAALCGAAYGYYNSQLGSSPWQTVYNCPCSPQYMGDVAYGTYRFDLIDNGHSASITYTVNSAAVTLSALISGTACNVVSIGF